MRILKNKGVKNGVPWKLQSWWSQVSEYFQKIFRKSRYSFRKSSYSFNRLEVIHLQILRRCQKPPSSPDLVELIRAAPKSAAVPMRRVLEGFNSKTIWRGLWDRSWVKIKQLKSVRREKGWKSKGAFGSYCIVLVKIETNTVKLK